MNQDETTNTGVTAQAASAETQTAEDLSAKEYVIDRIAQDITDFTGKKSGAKTLAKRLMATFTEALFAATVSEGYFRFGGGYGALKTKKIAATKRRVPATGSIVDCPARTKIVYVEGKTAKGLANSK